ncbi:MAG: saccharopine dehydrogenase family protein [Candidatus Helarchaeota archaeon]
MSKIVILGGCGAVGSYSSRILAESKEFDEVIIGDIDLDKAGKLAADLGSKVRAVKVNGADAASIKDAIKDMDVVLNCIGPFYKFEKTILSTVIEMGVDYVDICDDTGATYDALNLNGAAKDAGITALIGMGSSPGVTNVLAGFAAKTLLKETDSIDIYHAHGGEPVEGAGVIGHRFYCMRQEVPFFLDGKAINLTQKESEKHREEVEFINLKGKHLCYPYPHPEPITIPMFIKGLKRVTNKGTVLPKEYYDLTRRVFQCGLDSREPLNVKGQQVIPYDFAISYLIKRRDEILKETNFGEQRGCVKIVVKGRNYKGENTTFVFSLVSEGAGKGEAMGAGTGIPAAFGAILMQQGKIKEKGVVPPEACVDAMKFLNLMRRTLSVDEADKTKRSPLIVQRIDSDGSVHEIDL